MAKKEYKQDPTRHFTKSNRLERFDSADKFLVDVKLKMVYPPNCEECANSENWQTTAYHIEQTKALWDDELFGPKWVDSCLDWLGYELWNNAFNTLRKLGKKEGEASDAASRATDKFLKYYE